jgi:four helix bundle protein
MSDPSKLIVLEKSHRLLEAVNDAAQYIRQPHLRELKTQLIRTALSIPSNIAEGHRRASQREFLRFLDFALGSTGELETQLRAALDCRAIPRETCIGLSERASEIGKMLNGLIQKVAADLGEDT